MKIVCKIARAELRSLFYSPVAWFILLIFYLFGAISFIFPIERFTAVQEVLLEGNKNWFGFDGGIGSYIFKGVLDMMLGNLYMFIPLITMGIINREVNSGTIKLLYSAPLRSSEIVLGKYLGILIFNSFLTVVIAFFLLSGYFVVQHAEFNWYFSMLLGVFLLISAFAAIGMFISSLTNYQIVAAVITFALFFVFAQLTVWWQQYDIIRDLAFFLSMSGKAESMMAGLITTRDIFYFLLIILLFLAFTIIRLKSTQESKNWATVIYRYVGVLTVVLVVGYFTSMPGTVIYWDLTDAQKNTIHPNTQSVIKELDGSELTVTLYTNLFAYNVKNTLPSARNAYLWGFWEQYLRFYPNIEFEYEYFYDINPGDSTMYRRYPDQSLDEIIKLEAEALGVSPFLFKSPDAIKQTLDLSDEFFLPVMVVEYKGRREFLRCYMDGNFWPDQFHVSATLKRLVRERDPRIAFVAGHLEREIYSTTDRSYDYDVKSKLRTSLLNNGVDSDTINLRYQHIPDDLAVLVLADPKTVLDTIEERKIIDYLKNGGDAMIIADPGKQFISQTIANFLGVHLESGMIVRPDAHDLPHKFEEPLTSEGNNLANERPMERFRKYGIDGAFANVFGGAPLSYTPINGFTIEPIVTINGSSNTWVENGRLVLDSAAPVFDIGEGDCRKDKYVMALKMKRQINNKEQRIIISGDGDMLSNLRKHPFLGLSFYSWLLHNEYPKYANYPPAPDRFISIKSTTASVFTYIYLLLIPVIILSAAIILLVRRRKK